MTGENDAVEDLTEPSIAVVTGASSGIGLAAAEELARRGWTLALVGRDPDRLEAARTRVTAAAADAGGAGAAGADATTAGAVTAYRCDFAVLAEVRTLAATLRDTYGRIDVLANNAGGAVGSRQTTVDGYEATIQTNHLAPFLLSLELREQLRGGRIVTTASAAHQGGSLDPDDLSAAGSGYSMLSRYASAKQANVLFAAEAARRWPDICSTSYHPGVVRTRFGNDSQLYAAFYRFMPGLRTPARGARTLVWLSTVDSDQLVNGAYYQDEKPRRAATRATDAELAARLWDASLRAVGRG